MKPAPSLKIQGTADPYRMKDLDVCINSKGQNDLLLMKLKDINELDKSKPASRSLVQEKKESNTQTQYAHKPDEQVQINLMTDLQAQN